MKITEQSSNVQRSKVAWAELKNREPTKNMKQLTEDEARAKLGDGRSNILATNIIHPYKNQRFHSFVYHQLVSADLNQSLHGSRGGGAGPQWPPAPDTSWLTARPCPSC
jgi:hypothetical protein